MEKTKKHQPPSSAAISFYLRNRCPEEWSDKKELVLDTSQSEQARKELFLEMLRGSEPEVEEDSIVDCDQDNS